MLSSFAIIALVVVLLVVGILGGLFAYYRLKFRATPEARWARAVRAAAAELGAQVRAAESAQGQAWRELSTETTRLRERALEGFYGSISVEALADYPGIGPVTVSRLHERGLHHLGQLRKPLTVEIPGLGPKRM